MSIRELLGQVVFLALVVFLLLSFAAAAAEYLTPGISAKRLAMTLGTPEAPLIVDLRKPVEFKVGHIPGAINIPHTELKDHLDEFGHKNGVLIYCINGSRTRLAEQALLENGVSHVFHLDGAFYAWIQGGLEIEKAHRP